MLDFFTKFWKTTTIKVDDVSPKNTLDKTDATKTLRTAILMGLSAGLTGFINALDPTMIHSLLFFIPENMQSTVATLVITIISDLAMRFKKDNDKESK